MHTTNYLHTFITVSPDSPVIVATPPTKADTIAGRQYALLADSPYRLTSDELLLAVENERNGPVSAADFFAKPKACLRTSPLVKKQGYGLHFNAEGKVALVPMESDAYQRLLADPAVKKRPGIRSAR